MSKQTEALKLALEALEYISSHYMSLPKIGCMALAAIEEALAEESSGTEQPAQQEPVAWMQEMPVSGNEERSVRMTTVKMVADEWGNPIPLYTAPTTQPDTDCHLQGICQRSGYSIAPTPHREPEQEPVPWEQFYPDIGKPQTTHWEGCEAVHPECRKQEPDGISWLKRDSGYFTAPTPRKPLSEQQRIDLVRACGFPKFNDWHDAAIGVTHSVERAHGIGEQT